MSEDTQPTAPDGARPPVETIGKYEVIQRLGAGGMAEVFLARLPGMAGFSKTVVVKRLLPRFAQDPRYVQLFVDEAKLAAQVQHKNVVQIFELGAEGAGEVFMAMEYVTGPDLNTLLVRAGRDRRRVPVWLSLRVACEVLEALGFAYRLAGEDGRPRQIVHNDVSPENIFLALHGEVKLGDFGVAVDATRRTLPFADGVGGKVPYMAPERLEGAPPTHASDMFSVGVVLWECLTQRRLFAGKDSDEVTERVMAGASLAPSHFQKDVPAAVDDVVMQALARDPVARPEAAQKMQSVLHGEMIRLEPRIGLEPVRRILAKLLGQGASLTPAPTTPDHRVRSDLVSRPEFQRLISDVLTDVESTKGTLPDLPAELAATLSGTWPDTPLIPPPAEDDDDPETTAIVRPRSRPRSGVGLRPEPTPAAAPPSTPAPMVWVRSRGGVQIGPREPLEALGLLEELASDDARRTLELSADQVEWLPVLRLPVLLGEAHVDADPTLPAGEQTGTFQGKSPTAVLAEVARSGATGRLVFIRYETTLAERAELQIEMGHVVGFGTSRHLLPGWSKLLESPKDVAPDVVHALGQVIRTRRRLEEVGQRATQAHLHDARGEALERTLVAVHGWPWGRYAFEPGGHLEGGKVSARPIFALLGPVVAQAKTVPVIMAHLSAVIDEPLVRTPAFDREVRELGLDVEDQARLDRFGFGRSLRDSFASMTSLRDERPTVRLGYLLREVGLLEPTSASSRA